MQAALVLLGNASQHHAVQRRQVIFQQLNPFMAITRFFRSDGIKQAPSAIPTR